MKRHTEDDNTNPDKVRWCASGSEAGHMAFNELFVDSNGRTHQRCKPCRLRENAKAKAKLARTIKLSPIRYLMKLAFKQGRYYTLALKAGKGTQASKPFWAAFYQASKRLKKQFEEIEAKVFVADEGQWLLSVPRADSDPWDTTESDQMYRDAQWQEENQNER
jgi:hypothetical protein